MIQFSFSRACSVVLAALFVFAASMAAAQTGKVSAKLVDGKTGEPLLHASIQILETKQGAYSKENGVATIVNVSPSENYTLVAKYAGYEADTIPHVNVKSDQTYSITVKLGAKNIEIVVRSEKLVDRTKTDVSTKFAPSVIASMPGRQRLDQVILLTPGLVQDNTNGGFSVHGSRGDQNSVKYNGIEISDPLHPERSSVLQNSVSRLAISEVDVVTGNADASKGGFTGGQVNTQSRQGSSNLEMTAHYRAELPSLWGSSSNGYKQMGAGEDLYEFLVSGPLVGDAVKISITGKLNSFKYYNWFSDPFYDNEGLGVLDPLGLNTGQLPHTNRWRTSTTGKLTFDAFGFNTSLDAALSNENDLFNNVATMYLDPYYLGARNVINNVYSLNARGQIGDGILELNGGYSVIVTKSGKYDQSQTVNAFSNPHFMSIADDYTWDDQSQTIIKGPDGIIDIYTPVTKQIPDPRNPTQSGNAVPGINPFTGHIEGPPLTATTNNAFGLPVFPTVGNSVGILDQNLGQRQFKLQYSVQVGAHYLSGGAEGNLMSLYNYSNDLPWDANPFRDSFYVHPYTGAVNISDKMEFSDITLNPGLRFDIYQPDSKTINDIYNPLGTAGTSTTQLQTQLSPRLAITYAVTDQTTFDFGYNWYFRQPSLEFALTNAATSASGFQNALVRGNQTIGNGGLNAERTREVEVGFSTQPSDIFAISVHGIYKDLRNDVGLQRISSPLLASSYFLYSSDQYGNSRAIELILEKRMSDNYSAKVQYTYSSAKGTSTSATDNYAALINADPSSEQAVLPLRPFPLSFDKPHVAQLLLNVNYNKGEGPTIFGTKLLQELSLAATTVYESGTPYTRLDIRGGQIGETNGDRNPDYFQTDATLTRTIAFEDLLGPAFKTMFLDLQLEVLNVFNRTEAIRVYPTSGQGDNDGQPVVWPGNTDYVNDPINGPLDIFGKPLYNPVIAHKDAAGRPSDIVTVADQQASYERLITGRFARRTNYTAPRRVYLNATVRF